jgi:DNA-binding response OmpR family regulator
MRSETMSGMAERSREIMFRLRARRTILIVEKEAAIRELIEEMLDGEGFEVGQVSDAAGALDFARGGHQIDLLVTEAQPTGMRAQELTRLLYKLHPKMKILFMAGKFDEGFAHMLGDQGERLFLLKPFTRETLLRRINDILR